MEAVDQQITPDAIELDFAPRPAPSSASVRVGSELVAAAGPLRPCHVLNPTAALVWTLFDGNADVGTIAGELADAAGVEASVVAGDVLALTRHLGALELLAGVAPAPRTEAAVRSPVPEEGQEAEPFELVAEDGTLQPWESFRGQKVLLVNWSPMCSFCVRIGEDLARIDPQLEAAGVRMVLATVGDAEQNHDVLVATGLQGVDVLYKQHERDPFGGLGTPSALYFDEQGHVAAPLAVGAMDVPLLAARLAGLEPEEPGQGGARYLNYGAGVCAPGTVSIGRRSTRWAGTAVYRVGELHVGVRYNSDAAGDALDRLLPGARLADPRARENYSVSLADASGSARTRDLNLLLQGDQQRVRTRSPGRVLRALLGYLTMETFTPDRQLLQVAAMAVVRDGRAFLLPDVLFNMFSTAQPRLNRMGAQLVDRPWIVIDPRAVELVVPELRVPHDPGVLAEFDDLDAPGSELPPVGPGRYPLAGWVFHDDSHPEGVLPTPASVAQAAGLVTWVSSLRDVLDGAAAVFESAVGYSVHYESAENFLGKVGSILAGGGRGPA